MKADIPDLERPLDPDLQYFDATPSIETLAHMVRDLQKAMELQMTINGKLLLHNKDLYARVTELEAQSKVKENALILPERFNS